MTEIILDNFFCKKNITFVTLTRQIAFDYENKCTFDECC